MKAFRRRAQVEKASWEAAHHRWSPDPAGLEEARRAAQQAAASVEVEKARRVKSDDIAAALRAERDANHFGARIAASFQLR